MASVLHMEYTIIALLPFEQILSSLFIEALELSIESLVPVIEVEAFLAQLSALALISLLIWHWDFLSFFYHGYVVIFCLFVLTTFYSFLLTVCNENVIPP